MKVAVVFSGAHRRGGVERVAWELLRHLGERHTTWFVGGELESPELLPAGIRHVEIDCTDAQHPAKFRIRAAEALHTIGADRVVTLGANCPPGDLLMVGSVHRAWLRAGRPIPVKGLPIPAWVRFLMPRHRTLLRLERSYFTAPGRRQVVVVGEQVKSDLIAHYGVDPSSIVVMPNGFSVSEFSTQRRDSERASSRAEMGIADEAIALLFVGNELHRKGFGVLLRAVALTADQHLEVQVVGKADISDYARLIKQLGLEGRVRWHGPTNDVGKSFAAADLFVLPTQYEPFGIVIIEALAMGIPVITTSLAGAASAIAGSGAGLLQQDPDDVDELARLLGEALSGDNLAVWASKAPQAAAPYEWTEIMGRIERLLDART